MVLDVVNDHIIAGDKPADGGKGLAEGGHDQVHLICQTEMGCRTPPAAKHAHAVSIVHHQPSAVTLTQRHYFG